MALSPSEVDRALAGHPGSHHVGLTAAELRLADKTSAVIDARGEAERARASSAGES
jgi:hypothetical protein